MYPKHTNVQVTPISNPNHGFSLVEVILVVGLMGLLFSGLFALSQGLFTLIADVKARTIATELAVERLEFIRSLEYDDVGTVAGIPPGFIPQTRAVSSNGIAFRERVVIEYVDDAKDGTGASDSNAIVSDYKRVKVEYGWNVSGATTTTNVVSTIVPPGIETTAGGGTIRVNVFDKSLSPVSGAMVRFENPTLSPPVDTVRYTGPAGDVLLSGAPAGGGYRIAATDLGYSTDQTYLASSSNPNPIPPPIAVATATVSTINFQIDDLSSLLIQTEAPPTIGDFTDTFTDTSAIASSTGVVVTGGAAELMGGAGSYFANGTIISATSSPGTIERWYAASFSGTSTASTSLVVSVYYDDGSSLVPVPDGDLPGNSTGFTSSPINLETLPPGVYDNLALAATLYSFDSNETPQLFGWSISYVTDQLPVSSVPVVVRGSKTIGTDGGAPVYKFSRMFTSDGSGEISIPDLEFDQYQFSIADPSYRIIEVCPSNPLVVEPGAAHELSFTLGSAVSNRLRVATVDTGGRPVAGAEVTLSRAGYSETRDTTLCGQTEFVGGGLTTASDYTLEVAKPGYAASTVTGVTVPATSTVEVTLN